MNTVLKFILTFKCLLPSKIGINVTISEWQFEPASIGVELPVGGHMLVIQGINIFQTCFFNNHLQTTTP